MPRKLKRYHGRGDLHFGTFSCYERRALLGTVRARHLFLKILEQVWRRCVTSVVGYVVMPEHVHLVLNEPKKGTLPKLLQVLKQRVSHAMRGRRRRRVHPRDWPWSSWGFYATEEHGVVKVEPTGEDRQREESPPFAKTAKGGATLVGEAE